MPSIAARLRGGEAKPARMQDGKRGLRMIRKIKARTLIVGGVFTLLFFALLGRVFWVQVVNAAFWADQARKTWMTTKPIPQERGSILDRNGIVLAGDAVAYTVAVSPKIIHQLDAENPEWKIEDQIVSKLHAVLNKQESELRQIVDAKMNDGSYYPQREVRPEGWKVDKDVYDRLVRFKEELQKLTGKQDVGLYFLEEKKRYYPNGSLAAQVIGYEDKEGVGIMGLEKQYASVMEGSPGSIRYEKDGIRTQLPNGEVELKPAVDGKNVTLTIDRDIQFYIEQALREAYDRYHPVSATAIAADPNTMEILGMASLPDFDPNRYWLASGNMSAFKNNAIQSRYEPGSTFKIVTLAAAVQEGLFNPNEKYKSGSIRVADRTIHDIKRNGWGEITFLEGLKRSSNVAFVKLGYEKLGAEKLRKYINAFGFNEKTGIDLPGEISGLIAFHDEYPTEVATAAFGQGNPVTPIEQVAAVAAVANGGKLMQPHVVKAITDPATGKTETVQPKMIRQVISPETSRKVSEYLEQVVSDQEIGTGRNAYIPGYRIAGKTGTAQTVVDGKYSPDKYVVSFIGYAPVDKPKIVLLVMMDRPDVPEAGGGALAAPIFKQIMEQSLQHLGIQPDLPKETEPADETDGKDAVGPVTAQVPDAVGQEVAQAKKTVENSGFDVEIVGKGSKVLQQLPKAGSILPQSQRVYLLTDAQVGTVPSLTGLSLRDALEMCSLLGASCSVEGEGYVAAQTASRSGGQLQIHLTLAPPGELASQTPGDADGLKEPAVSAP
jgi:penicillin-binding protein 2B